MSKPQPKWVNKASNGIEFYSGEACPFSVVEPTTTRNLVTNPSFELATTGYSISGAGLARTTAGASRGFFGAEITPSTSAASTAILSYSIASGLTASAKYSFGCDVELTERGQVRLSIVDSVVGTLSSEVFSLKANKRERIGISTVLPASVGTITLKLTKVTGSTNKFYSDGWQFESGEITTYIDGDQEGGRWVGAKHASQSDRLEGTIGGRVRLLSELGYRLTGWTGFGMPPLNNATTPYAYIGGEALQRTTAQARMPSLVGVIEGRDLPDKEQQQLELENIFAPNYRFGTAQPLALRYRSVAQDGQRGTELEIAVIYERGMEDTDDNPYQGQHPITFKELTPPDGITELFQRGQDMTLFQTVTNVNFIQQRDADGAWGNLNQGFANIPDSRVTCLAYSPDGDLYAGGIFAATQSGSVTVNNIAKFDKVTGAWVALGSGTKGTNGEVYQMIFDATGLMYLVGAFTTAGGTTVNRIATYDPNTDTFAAIGSGTVGANGAIWGICFDASGNLWIAGKFSNVAGVAGFNNVAYWDGSAWVNPSTGLGTGGTDTVYTLALYNGAIVAGGDFTGKVARWDGAAWVVLGAIGAGTVYCSASTPFGLVVGGSILTADGITVNRVCTWNGYQWLPMDDGLKNLTSGGTVYTLFYDKERNRLYAGGQFNATGGGLSFAGRHAVWVGSVWQQIDTNMPASATFSANVRAMVVGGDGTLTIGHERYGNTKTAAITEIDYEGTAEINPTIVITGGGRPSSIINYTTGAAIYFNDIMLPQEVQILALNPRKRKFSSSVYGNVIGRVLRGSDWGTFTLRPGMNKIGVLMANTDSTSKIAFQWKNTHQSLKASSRG